MKSSQDIWLSTCAVFMEMAHETLEFINAYRVGDAIVIEHGYQWQLPIWEMLRQKKYIQITYGQQETLYRDNAYSRLQEIRLNRFVRRYHASTGKRCVAQDEFLEHGNRFFSNFPMLKSLLGFANQSLYVGVGLMCRNFTDMWYTLTFKGDVAPDYTSTVALSMTPERKLIYEVLTLENQCI